MEATLSSFEIPDLLPQIEFALKIPSLIRTKAREFMEEVAELTEPKPIIEDILFVLRYRKALIGVILAYPAAAALLALSVVMGIGVPGVRDADPTWFALMPLGIMAALVVYRRIRHSF